MMKEAARTEMEQDRGLAGELVKGAVAGALATWAMGKVTTFLYEHEGEAARRREERARGGRYSYEVAAEKLGRLVGAELDEGARRRLGSALHWLMGIGAGAAYAALRRRFAALHAGHGLGFGTGFFLAVDEGANTALGLTPPPRAFPWQAHARGLAGHVVYGLTADAALHALDALGRHTPSADGERPWSA